jgi:hypothetical protein
MPNPSVEREIIAQLTKLSLEEQQRVLRFVRSLTTAEPVGMPGKDLLRFAGAIEADDLQAMARAIEEACEKINLNEALA